MKKKMYLLLLALTSLFSAQAQLAVTKAKSTEIMILGSYHMSNPGLDAYNIEADDVLSPKRQVEMDDLSKQLAAFKPTHVVVEILSSQDSMVNLQFQQYLHGKFTLPANEAYQLGFRLAKMSGSEKIYCVDESGNFDLENVVRFAMQNGFQQLVQEISSTIQNHMQEEEAFLRQHSLSDYFKRLNDPFNHNQGIDWHLKFLSIAKNQQFPGADLMTDLYQRNLKIVGNILKITDEDPESRILVIYGNGHAGFFKSILGHSNEIAIIESYDYIH